MKIVQKNYFHNNHLKTKQSMLLWMLVIIVFMLCLIIIINFSPNSLSQRHHLVEHFNATYHPYSYTISLVGDIQKHHKNIDIICYMTDDMNEKSFIPNSYGLERLRYQYSILPIAPGSTSTPTRVSTINQKHFIRGMAQDLYQQIIDFVYQCIHSHSGLNPLITANSIVQLSNQASLPSSFTYCFAMSWDKDIPLKDLEQYHYNLFLVADEITLQSTCYKDVLMSNIAYDFIPFAGDDVKQYRGKGFPLINTSRVPDLSKRMLRLTTEVFYFPDTENLAHEKLVKSWSLHLFIENQEQEIVYSKRVAIKK
ncbi:MAG TPA: hypothetical protein PK581_01520 [Caldisericia bacterium]|nr:hypothetical protein [Caldisericia bacterium]